MAENDDNQGQWVDLNKQLYLDPQTPEPIQQKFALYELVYAILGLVLGLVCIIGGIILFLRGVTGSTSWAASFIGLESNITDAAPGAILFIIGLFIVLITRFKIVHHKSS